MVEKVFDCIPDVMFFVKDASGRYTAVNNTTVQKSGNSTKADLIGKLVSEVFPLPYSEGVSLQDKTVLSTGMEIRDSLEMYLSPQKTPRWCLTHKFPLHGERGETAGVIGISRDLPNPDERHIMYQRVARSLEYLQGHFAEDLRIPDLARIAGYSSDQYERAIRVIFHLSPKQLLTKVRLEAAVLLLNTTDRSISEIAHGCGYSDHSAFTRVFKRVVNATPQEFRIYLNSSKGI